MAKKNYEIKLTGTYGKQGDVVEIEGELTDRQKIMLKPYSKAVVSVKADTKELDKANAEIAALKKQLEAKA